MKIITIIDKYQIFSVQVVVSLHDILSRFTKLITSSKATSWPSLLALSASHQRHHGFFFKMQFPQMSSRIERESSGDYLLVSSFLLDQLEWKADDFRHIFCHGCADSLGLSRPTTSNRLCPACQTALLNPDDAVSTILNPTEDYKTSVLSGLDPNTIMECAGRALAFWAYQSTQEMSVSLPWYWLASWNCPKLTWTDSTKNTERRRLPRSMPI